MEIDSKGAGKGASSSSGPEVPSEGTKRARGGGTVVQCDGCGAEDGWKRMHSVRIPVAEGSGDDEENWAWLRKCAGCLAKDRGITLPQAQAAIVEENPAFQRQVQRAESFKEAKSCVQREYPGLGSGRQVYRMALAEFQNLMADLATAIRRKEEHMWLMVNKQQECQSLLAELRTAPTAARCTAILEQLDKAYEMEFLAFSAHSPEVQSRFLSAASYSDEWACNKDGTHFRCWYICLAHNPRCMTVLLSKSWQTKKADPLATKQTWYCECGAAFKAKWGCILEVRKRDGTIIMYKSEVPDWTHQDIRAIVYEQRYKPSTPEQLYAQVPIRAPTTEQHGGLIQEVDRSKGTYKISDEATYDAMPMFKWNQIFNMA
jgi:hypothetical protein